MFAEVNPNLSYKEVRTALLHCAMSPHYFIHHYCQIEDKIKGRWVPFHLWAAQSQTLGTLLANRQVVILKARQLGLTWLALSYALWMMLFEPGSGVLLFSRRDDEAGELLERLKNMHRRLPPFMQAAVTVDNAHQLGFGGLGSWARSFPTTRHSGRTYTATMAIVDEADFIQWLKRLLNAVKPTIDAGGRLVLISTVDKEHRGSEFKRLWTQASRGGNNYHPVFLPWHARPDRTPAWYRRQQRDYEQDDLFQEYPAQPEEALASRSANKRFNPIWLAGCRGACQTLDLADAPPIPGLRLYASPQVGRRYLVAADPAEGNPGSDPSAATVLDSGRWEQVAVLHGRFEPDIFAAYLVELARYYNQAEIAVERNNHGHAVLLSLEYASWPLIYTSPFDRKPGWLSNPRTKVLSVDYAAYALRESACRLNDEATLAELARIEAGSLRAPEGEHDDLAMALIIALAALRWPSYQERPGKGISVVLPAPDPLEGLEF